MEIIIIVLAILLNGFFALAEIAVLSSRKSKLKQKAGKGIEGAEKALHLAQNPNIFLSTVQVGITLVGIFAGAYGGSQLARPLAESLENLPFVGTFSQPVSLAIVVLTITYLSLVIGELVPKRIALSNPEKYATYTSGIMTLFSRTTTPLVNMLSTSTDFILNRLLGIKQPEDLPVSEDEIKTLIREGARAGVFEFAEKDIVERTFKLADKKINALMTPRNEIVWLDINDSFKTVRNKISKHPHSYYPICQGEVDKVLGIIRTEDLLANYLKGEKIDFNKALLKPLFIPENVNALRVLEMFKQTGIHMGLIIDEYGNIDGLIWIQDILEALVGELPEANRKEEEDIIKRSDGSFLVDGMVTLDEFKDFFKISGLPGEHLETFHTIGGFVMYKLGKVPVSGDKIRLENHTIEIMDMDGNRVDKILVKEKK